MDNHSKVKRYADKLLLFGILLFLLGLIVGFFIPVMTSSRLGVSAHLEGTMNGMFLLILGLLWHKLYLSEKALKSAFWLALYGTYTNFIAVTLSAITGSGKMMPVAGGQPGDPVTEAIIAFLLISLSIAMVIMSIIVFFGLYNNLKKSIENV